MLRKAEMKYTNDELLKIYLHLESNPYATYDELSKLFQGKKVNINSLVKRLQRMGCITVERDIDLISGKIKGTRKNCERRP